MNDPRLNDLLKWGIQNSSASNSTDAPDPSKSSEASTQKLPTPSAEALAALFTPQASDAELMKASMAVLTSSSQPVADRVAAADNLEQLIESIDNAKDLQPLGLWTPLLSTLEDPEPEVRRMAAWCVATAVQNNPAAQERALALGAVEKLVILVRAEAKRKEDEGEGDARPALVRRKAVFALSSLVRNYKPAIEELRKLLPKLVADDGDAEDMEKVDRVMERLRTWDGSD